MSMALSAILGAGTNIAGGFLASNASKKLRKAAKEAALREAELERNKGRRLQGRQLAGFSAAGVVVDEGTPLDILAQTAADAEISALRAAFALEQQARNLKSAGRSALISGFGGGGSTLLGSFGD